MKTARFQKGDLIKITNVGNYYPSWEGLAKKLGAKDWLEKREPIKHNIGIVIGIKRFEIPNNDICLVKINGFDFLIGEEGITLEKEREWDLVEN